MPHVWSGGEAAIKHEIIICGCCQLGFPRSSHPSLCPACKSRLPLPRPAGLSLSHSSRSTVGGSSPASRINIRLIRTAAITSGTRGVRGLAERKINNVVEAEGVEERVPGKHHF